MCNPEDRNPNPLPAGIRGRAGREAANEPKNGTICVGGDG
jgi:hypothetical protein